MKLPAFLASVCILFTSGCQMTKTIKETELKHHNFKLQTMNAQPIESVQVINIEFKINSIENTKTLILYVQARSTFLVYNAWLSQAHAMKTKQSMVFGQIPSTTHVHLP